MCSGAPRVMVADGSQGPRLERNRSLRYRATGRSPSDPPQDRVSSLLLSGGAAGAVSKFVTAPIDRVKIMYQVSPSRQFSLAAVTQTGVDIVRKSGFTALWRGNLAAVVRDVPYAALLFSTFSLYEEVLCGCLGRQADVITRGASGCAAGATATCLTYPLDVLRARFAAEWASTPRYTSYLQGVREIAAKEGASAFYSGLRPTLLGVMPYAALSFAAFETLKSILQRHASATSQEEIPVVQRLAAGGISGATAQTTTYPLHVVRRRMQVRPTQSAGYRSTLHGLRKIYFREGVAGGLYKGLTLTLLKGPMQSAVRASRCNE